LCPGEVERLALQTKAAYVALQVDCMLPSFLQNKKIKPRISPGERDILIKIFYLFFPSGPEYNTSLARNLSGEVMPSSK
jgi:hypothetical protein